MLLKVFKEIEVENFSNWAKDINLLTQESERTPKKINPKISVLKAHHN